MCIRMCDVGVMCVFLVCCACSLLCGGCACGIWLRTAANIPGSGPLYSLAAFDSLATLLSLAAGSVRHCNQQLASSVHYVYTHPADCPALNTQR